MEENSYEEEEGIVESENFLKVETGKAKLYFITFDLDRCQHLVVDSLFFLNKSW